MAVLGELAVGRGMHHARTLHVRADLAELDARLGAALDALDDQARGHGLVFTSCPEKQPAGSGRAGRRGRR